MIAAKIKNGAVTGNKLADNAVTASKIAGEAVTTGKIVLCEYDPATNPTPGS